MRFRSVSMSGQVVDLDPKGSQQGMGMHSLFIGTTARASPRASSPRSPRWRGTHSPEVANVVFFDFKLKSAAGVLEQFPHVVASGNPAMSATLSAACMRRWKASLIVAALCATPPARTWWI